jgi:hypothetical protein
MHLFLLLNFAYMLLIVIGLESMYVEVEVDNLHDLLLRLDFTLSDVLSQNIL